MPHNVVPTRKLGRSRKMHLGIVIFSDVAPRDVEDTEGHHESIEPSVSGDTADEIVRRSTPGYVGASQPNQPKRTVNRLKCELMGSRNPAQIFGGMEGERTVCESFGMQTVSVPCTDGGRVCQGEYKQGGRSPKADEAGRRELSQSKSRIQIRHQELWEKSEYSVVVSAWESHVHGEGSYRSGSKFGEASHVISSSNRRGWRS
jgi:hypothetical protein